MVTQEVLAQFIADGGYEHHPPPARRAEDADAPDGRRGGAPLPMGCRHAPVLAGGMMHLDRAAAARVDSRRPVFALARLEHIGSRAPGAAGSTTRRFDHFIRLPTANPSPQTEAAIRRPGRSSRRLAKNLLSTPIARGRRPAACLITAPIHATPGCARAATLGLMTIGSAAMRRSWSRWCCWRAGRVRRGARRRLALPYTLLMAGLRPGRRAMGRLADRFGGDAAGNVLIGAAGWPAAALLAAAGGSILGFRIVSGALLGFLGSSATFAPLVADTSLWFVRRRGIAVAICASGNYVAGAIWPPVVQQLVDSIGWRQPMLQPARCGQRRPVMPLLALASAGR